MRTRSTAEKIELVQRFERELWPALDQGRLVPQLDQSLPLSEVAAAHLRMEHNRNAGKIVLQVSAEA